jgi:hypothetical protein
LPEITTQRQRARRWKRENRKGRTCRSGGKQGLIEEGNQGSKENEDKQKIKINRTKRKSSFVQEVTRK